MVIDIAKIYQKIKSREERDRGREWSHIAIDARNAAKNIILNPTLKAVAKFTKIEKIWLAHRDSFLEPVSGNFADAIRSGNWESSYSTINNLNTGYDPARGWIYLLVSDDRVGQIKIGATKNELRDRLVRFRRINSVDATFHWAQWVSWPARLESAMHFHYKDRRTAGNTVGESNEWFHVSPRSAMMLAKKILRNGSESLYADDRGVLICRDPEGRIEKWVNW